MNAWLIALGATLACLAGLAVMTRWRYEATRPFTEPLACDSSYHGMTGHYSWCYRRPHCVLIDSAAAALAYAVMLASIWPLALIGFGAVAGARKIAGNRELPEERAARVARMERELGLKDRP